MFCSFVSELSPPLNIGNMFHFTCFNVDDPDDPSVGLINGELAITGNLLRREVFDPVIDQVRTFLLSHESNNVSQFHHLIRC